VFGVSSDARPAHRRFSDKECLPFDLLSDEDGRIARLYGTGITNLILLKLLDRVTFVIGKNGKILRTFDRVSPMGHASEVLSFVRQAESAG